MGLRSYCTQRGCGALGTEGPRIPICKGPVTLAAPLVSSPCEMPTPQCQGKKANKKPGHSLATAAGFREGPTPGPASSGPRPDIPRCLSGTHGCFEALCAVWALPEPLSSEKESQRQNRERRSREGRTELLSAYQAQRGDEHMAKKQNREPDLKESVF